MEKRILWLYITVFFNTVAFGMITPILPLFAKHFSASSFEVGMLTAVFALSQFIFSPLTGRLSDRYGRKPILLFSIAFTAFALLIIGLSQSLTLIFIGTALQGIGSAGVLPASLAYIADITKGSERSKFISRVTGTFALGFMIGPVIGGYLGSVSLSTPFLVAGLVAVLNSISIYFFLTETHHKRDTSLAIRHGFLAIKPLITALRGETGVLFFLLFVWALYISNFSITLPFLLEQKFSLGTVQSGLFFSVVGLIAAVTQWVILPFITKRVGDKNTIVAGLIFLLFGQFLVPYASTVGLLYSFFVITVLGSALTRPSTNSLLSKLTKEGQGSTMGLASSFESLGRVIGPLFLGVLISGYGLDAPFWVTSFIILAALLLFLKVERY